MVKAGQLRPHAEFLEGSEYLHSPSCSSCRDAICLIWFLVCCPVRRRPAVIIRFPRHCPCSSRCIIPGRPARVVVHQSSRLLDEGDANLFAFLPSSAFRSNSSRQPRTRISRVEKVRFLAYLLGPVEEHGRAARYLRGLPRLPGPCQSFPDHWPHPASGAIPFSGHAEKSCLHSRNRLGPLAAPEYGSAM